MAVPVGREGAGPGAPPTLLVLECAGCPPGPLLADAVEVLLGPHVDAFALEDERAAEGLQLVARQLLVLPPCLHDHRRALVAADVDAVAGRGDARVAGALVV